SNLHLPSTMFASISEHEPADDVQVDRDEDSPDQVLRKGLRRAIVRDNRIRPISSMQSMEAANPADFEIPRFGPAHGPDIDPTIDRGTDALVTAATPLRGPPSAELP